MTPRQKQMQPRRHEGTTKITMQSPARINSLARRCAWIFAISVLAVTPKASAQQPARGGRFEAGTISGLPARNIGSAQMSGRVAAVAALDDNGRITVFVGSASGGVWKSVDGGTTFKPVFDQQNVLSIGAVA